MRNKSVKILISGDQVEKLSRDEITYQDLPTVFEGTEKSCRLYCDMFSDYSFRKDENLFGGYWVNDGDGSCMFIV